MAPTGRLSRGTGPPGPGRQPQGHDGDVVQTGRRKLVQQGVAEVVHGPGGEPLGGQPEPFQAAVQVLARPLHQAVGVEEERAARWQRL